MFTESTYHLIFVMNFFVLSGFRIYYRGIADAGGDKISDEGEGLKVRILKYLFGGSYVASNLAFFLRAEWMDWSQLLIPGWARWVGVVVSILSTFLYIQVHRSLGKNFTDTVVVRKTNTLVTSGPYHYVRHPMYSSILMYVIGTFLLTANWFIGLTGLCLLTVLVVYRTPIEEQKLLEKHGDAYRQYSKKTPRYFPRF